MAISHRDQGGAEEEAIGLGTSPSDPGALRRRRCSGSRPAQVQDRRLCGRRNARDFANPVEAALPLDWQRDRIRRQNTPHVVEDAGAQRRALGHDVVIGRPLPSKRRLAVANADVRNAEVACGRDGSRRQQGRPKRRPQKWLPTPPPIISPFPLQTQELEGRVPPRPFRQAVFRRNLLRISDSSCLPPHFCSVVS